MGLFSVFFCANGLYCRSEWFRLIFTSSNHAQSICMMILHRHGMCDNFSQGHSWKSWVVLKKCRKFSRFSRFSEIFKKLTKILQKDPSQKKSQKSENLGKSRKCSTFFQNDPTFWWMALRKISAHAMSMQNHHTNRLRVVRARENQSKPPIFIKQLRFHKKTHFLLWKRHIKKKQSYIYISKWLGVMVLYHCRKPQAPQIKR